MTISKFQWKWQQLHSAAFHNPKTKDERAIMATYRHLLRLVDMYGECGHGVPHVLAPMIESARNQLQYESGQLDRGTMDKLYLMIADDIRYDMANDKWLDDGESNLAF